MRKALKDSKWLLLILGIVFFSFAELKIGYINSERIINEYQGTKEAQDKFNKEVARWEQEAQRDRRLARPRRALDQVQSVPRQAAAEHDVEFRHPGAQRRGGPWLGHASSPLFGATNDRTGPWGISRPCPSRQPRSRRSRLAESRSATR